MVTQESAVRELRENTTDGAAVLARRAISLLSSFVADAGVDGLVTNTRRCAENLRDARPSMTGVGNLVQFWMATFAWPREDFRRRAHAHCESVLARADRALDKTVRDARSRLGGYSRDCVVLTHSASSTVRSAIADMPFRVMVTASEPGGEGRRMAAELGLPCVDDDDAPRLFAGVAAVVVGADAVGRETFVNQVGTRVLALAATASSTPFFVAAESYKWLPQAHPHVAEPGFEATSNALVTAFLTDKPAEFPRCFTR